MIKTLKGLYLALNFLFDGISEVCRKCQDDDCKGYVWLLPKEADRLLKRGVEILEINGNICFIQAFTDVDDRINIEQFKPPCPLCLNRKCTIYPKRPLVCRMYPLSFATEDGKVYLTLHLDCLYSRQKVADVLFQNQAVMLFERLHPQLLKEILETYRLVNSLSRFPEGKNRYLRLVAIDQFPKERR